MLRSTRCKVPISSRLAPNYQAQHYASFRRSPSPEDEPTEEEHATDLSALGRRAAQAKREASQVGSDDRQLRELYTSDPDVANYYNRPISWKPLLVGLGICVTAFLAAETIDGRADAQAIDVLSKTGWRTGTIRDAKRTTAAHTTSPLTLIDRFLGTDAVKWWSTRSDGDHAAVIIIAINAAVFLAWGLASKVPAMSYRMGRSFIHFPGVTPPYTLLTSVFSHQSFTHFAFNMIGLYSFGPPCFDYLTDRRRTQYPNFDESVPQRKHSMNLNSTFHSIAFFVSCGVCANLIPHYIRLLSLRSRTLMLSKVAPTFHPMPGLGASGAVYSCLVIDAIHHPNHQIALIFLPFVPVGMGYAVPGMIALDTVGVLRGWHTFDHLCHLSGAALGAGAYQYGPAVWYKAQSLLRGGKISSR
ncbi:hypothetical protein E6O75_ATG00786 [Venturia nashicola]|uniref:Peptidase S54 rhomboid domain-containing protein n=1 Tax=Venturia nashicola TaxID=86259 RepID=A0A4Z1PCK3_9PEZI|nr:hypothetical protein E6O75_ATG00786 [Venturia nashicola]